MRYDYEDFSSPFHVDLNRTFIRDGSLFFVYDDLISSDNIPRTYWNLMQSGFNNNKVAIKDLDNTEVGLFQNSTYDNIFNFTKGELTPGSSSTRDRVDFSIGSTMPASINPINIDYSESNVAGQYCLPTDDVILERTGLERSYGDSSSPQGIGGGINHARIRSVATGIVPKFLTVIAPRETYDGAQLITQTINTPEGHYGTMIMSKSHTNTSPTSPTTLCTTYCGCSVGNGNNITATYNPTPTTTCAIRTNAKFYLVTRPNNIISTSAVVDNSLVIMHGSFINVNDTPVYQCSSPVIIGMSASYLSGALHVDFNATAETHPKFKISRSGILPEQFSASLSYSSSLPPTPISSLDNPYPQSEPQNIIDRLAYDDNYFYVNYSIAELANDSNISMDEDLCIYSGTYYNTDIPDLLQFNGPNITLYGNWFIPHGKEMRLLENCNLKLNYDFKLTVEGELDITGTQDNVCNLSRFNTSLEYWEGIEVSSEGQLNLEYCNIEKAFSIIVYGAISSHNATINRSRMGVRLCSIGNYQIENTVISNGEFAGVYFINCVRSASSNIFSHNQIINNLYGISLYNSSPCIKSTVIQNNERAGIICTYNANPVVLKSSILDSYLHNNNQGVYSPETPEVIVYEDCFPQMHLNDIIFDDGYSLLLFDQYPDFSASLECQENYWGTIDESEIMQSFYPPRWNVLFQDILTQSVHANQNGTGIVTDYFLTAVNYEETGDKIAAGNMYRSIIENYPTNAEAPAAASRLVCIAETDEDLLLTKEYLDGIYELYPSTNLAKSAYLDSLLCESLLKDYQAAIDGYVDKLQYCTSYMDSLLTTLNIIYTYLEADANGYRSAVVNCQIMGTTLKSAKQAREMEAEIMGVALNRPIPGEVTYHVPDVITSMNNYPNPFNPTTTIKFSTPKTSKCELIIYNIKGQAVKHLVSGSKSRGIYKTEWNADDDNGKRVSSGVYFYRLNIDGHISTRKMVLMK